MRLALVYDLRQDYRALGFSDIDVAEFDSIETIDALDAALRGCGAEVERIGRGHHLAARLVRGDRWDLVFSIAEGLRGRSREAHVPAVCELFDQPYVFSDPLTMAVTLDKAIAKRIVRDFGIPTAKFDVVEKPDDVDHVALPFPLFVKPIAEGTGKGCEAGSLVRSRSELLAAAGSLLARFRQPVLAEVFLPGREFTVGVLGTGASAKVIGVMEVSVRKGVDERVYSFENKQNCVATIDYALVADDAAQQAARAALAAYRALDCRDAARLDFRCDCQGVPHFLEVNPIAGLQPGYSDLPMIADFAGFGYQGLISGILQSACERLGISLASAALDDVHTRLPEVA